MKLSLKNIKVINSMSEETDCFTATLCINGKRSYLVKNRGHGGCNSYHPVVKSPIFTIADIDRHLAENHESKFEFAYDTDFWCSDQVGDFLLMKQLKSLIKNNIVGVLNSKIYKWKAEPKNEIHVRQIVIKEPTAIILNNMPLAKAFKLFKECVS